MCSESMMPSSSGSGVADLIQRAKSVRVDGAGQPALSKAMICNFLLTLCLHWHQILVVQLALGGVFRCDSRLDVV
jgi:hypothetical protein